MIRGSDHHGLRILETPLAFAPYPQQMEVSLGRQYLVTFVALPNQAGYEAIRVTTEHPGVKLIAPAPVYVPAGRKGWSVAGRIGDCSPGCGGGPTRKRFLPCFATTANRARRRLPKRPASAGSAWSP